MASFIQEKKDDVVAEGKIIDFIDETPRNDTPEEYVRQQIERSIIKEYLYPKEDCGIEFTIKMGTSKKRADIVVFQQDAKHGKDNVKIIFECKQEGVSPNDKKEGIEQLKSYMSACLNAEFGYWTNSKDRFCIRKVIRGSKYKFEEVNDIPKFGQTLEEAEKISLRDLREATGDNLKFTFRRCHDYIAGNQGLQKPEAFWELLKIIFCKIDDEREGKLQFYATSDERKSLNGQLAVKKRIETIFNRLKQKEEFSQLFGKDEQIYLESRVIAFIISQIQNYSLLETDVDVKGAAYEEIVGSNLRGDRGEFFTPRNICRMVVKMMDPKLNEKILDPACGTGGFLVIGMNHVVDQIRKSEIKRWKDELNPTDNERREFFRKISKYCDEFVNGFDFNPNLVKAAKMNMVMNNDGSGSMFQANSLEHPHRWSDELRKKFGIDNSNISKFKVVITNPPFGTKIPVDDPNILQQYDLGHKWGKGDNGNFVMKDDLQKSVSPEILFIERCLQLLEEGGRMAIVLPDAILGAPGLESVRYWILKNAKVIASIDLDKDTFQPKNGTQTSVLMLMKKTRKEMDIEEKTGKMIKYPVFMAIADKIGHDKRGKDIFRRDEEGNDILETRIEIIKEKVDGKIKTKTIKTRHRVLDDVTMEIANLFTEWKKGPDF